MANPLNFKPLPVDPRTELQRRVAEAPVIHAEALLVAWDVLQAAHDQGILDMMHGMIGAKDTITGKVAEYAKLPEGTAAIRNLLTFAKIMSELDPELLDQVSKAMSTASREHQREEKPPSLWQLFRRSTDEDSRRGLSFLTMMLSGLGKSLKR